MSKKSKSNPLVKISKKEINATVSFIERLREQQEICFDYFCHKNGISDCNKREFLFDLIFNNLDCDYDVLKEAGIELVQ